MSPHNCTNTFKTHRYKPVVLGVGAGLWVSGILAHLMDEDTHYMPYSRVFAWRTALEARDGFLSK